MTSPVTIAMPIAMAAPARTPISAISTGGWPGCHKGVDTAKKMSNPTNQAAAVPGIHRQLRGRCRRSSNHCATPIDASSAVPVRSPTVSCSAKGQAAHT